MATTRLGQFGIGVEPYGTFQPKTAAPDTDPHNPGLITRLGQFGIGLSKYGVFQPKSEAAPEPEPTGQVGSTGGGGKKYRQYRTDSLDLDYWRRNRKKLEARVETLQKKIQAKRDQIDYAPSYERLETLKRQIADLQKKLLDLLGELDMLKKLYEAAEDAEAMEVYLAYRSLH